MPGLPKINILSPFVADLIAAGEVVERPASVVKELLENAVDAGARNVTLELRGGGREYIRVTDDGCGMSPEDAGIAFLRHATSKLSDARGLEAIGTLGFRGEALAAISSVSHIELSSCERGAGLGVRMKLDAGEISDMYETGCPEGTTMIVRGLFYNTPARLKFMKTDRAEGAACVQAALRCALGRPDVSFRCIRDGREEFFTPGDGRRDSAVYALLGRELAAAMLEVELEDGPFRVRGFVSEPALARGNRSAQYFFCNGRPIRSQLLQAALEQAYRGTMLTGRFPACVLYIELAPAAVDVNVHPAKKTSMIIETADAAPFQKAQVYLAKFAFATDVTFTEKYEGSTDGMVQVSTHAARGFIPMMELIDRDKELARLNKEKAKAEKEMAMFANQLNNPKFVERAPAALVEDIRNKYAKSQDKLANIEQSIKALG